jgi:hypothetical protein
VMPLENLVQDDAVDEPAETQAQDERRRPGETRPVSTCA